MAVTPFKAILFAGGGIVAAASVAYVSGALDPYLKAQPPAEVAMAPTSTPTQSSAEVSPGTGVHDVTPPASVEPASKPATEASMPAAQDGNQPSAAAPETGAMKPTAPDAGSAASPQTAPATAAGSVLPTFDVVRVESGGSLVVAGNAAPKAKVEILSGATVIGSTTAGPDGAFAIVLDDPLKPGDYQLTLRSTTPDNVTAASGQTAVVSVPDKPGGQVLAMVEEPGKASELMAVPQPAKQGEQPVAAGEPAAKPSDGKMKPGSGMAETPASTAGEPKVVVEAVEIDGNKIFIAGLADAGRKVRAYANDILLGDGETSPDGHFLVEAMHDLPVGTYTVRVDGLGADGSKVVARATVPFEREPGEAMAAVAPTVPDATTPKSSAAQPSDMASSAPATQAQDIAPATAQSGTATKSAAEEAPAVIGQAPAAEQPSAAQPSAQQPSTEQSPAAASSSGQPSAPTDVATATPPSDGVPETVSPKLEHAAGAVIIRRKDTLWHISRRVYGRGTRYSTIYLANQDQIGDPDRIWPGQVFRVPEVSKQGEPADKNALGDQATTPPGKVE